MRNHFVVSTALFCLAAGSLFGSVNLTSTGTITIPSGTGQISSAVTASGLTGQTIQTITVTLNNWTENGADPGPADREFMLVFQPAGGGPAQTFQFLGGYGNNNCGFSNLSPTFADGTGTYAPDNYGWNGDTCAASGDSGDNKPSASTPTYLPTVNYGGNKYCSADVSGAQFVSPAPTTAQCATDNSHSPGTESSGGTATFGSQFSGDPDGTWTLYIRTGSLGSQPTPPKSSA